MRRLAHALEAAGYETFVAGYPSQRATIAELAKGLAPAVLDFAGRVGRLHFVGHSMGGLMARALIADFRPPRLGRVVTIGTPHGGTEIADRLKNNPLFRAYYGPAGAELGCAASPALNAQLGGIDYPLGSIAGTRALNFIAARFVLPRPNDGTVSVASTRVEGMADHRLVACNHFYLPQDAEVIALCRAFLSEGRF